jgi:signal transduction histidine kinase
MTIALSNVIENALKYSYSKTRIYLRSEVRLAGDLELAAAVIEVDNLGEEIRFEHQEAIFEQGTRGLTRAKMGRIPGTGLGLWEARAVVEAHGGKITVSCRPTAIHRRQGKAFRVIFSLRIPLRQAK